MKFTSHITDIGIRLPALFTDIAGFLAWFLGADRSFRLSLLSIACFLIVFLSTSSRAQQLPHANAASADNPLERLRDIVEPEFSSNWAFPAIILCVLLFTACVAVYFYLQNRSRSSNKLIAKFQEEARLANNRKTGDSDFCLEIGAAFRVACYQLTRDSAFRSADYSSLAALCQNHAASPIHADEQSLIAKLEQRFDPAFSLSNQERDRLPRVMAKLLGKLDPEKTADPQATSLSSAIRQGTKPTDGPQQGPQVA